MTSDRTEVLPIAADHNNLRELCLFPASQVAAPSRTTAAAVSPGLRLAALTVAVLAAVGVYAVWRFFVATRTGQLIDQLAYAGAYTGRTKLWTLAQPVLDLVSDASIIIGTGTIAGIALLRRRWLVAVQAVLVIAGANLTTQLLKYNVFDRPVLGSESWWANSLPSGHTTVAASVSVALLLAVPRTARPALAIAGTVFTALIGISTLIGRWHRPSDVVAAILVSLVWGALACVVMTESAQDAKPNPARRRFVAGVTGTVWAVVILGVTTLVAASFAAWALIQTAAFVSGREVAVQNTEALAYVGGAAGVIAAAALAFAVLLAIRQAVARPRSLGVR